MGAVELPEGGDERLRMAGQEITNSFNDIDPRGQGVVGGREHLHSILGRAVWHHQQQPIAADTLADTCRCVQGRLERAVCLRSPTLSRRVGTATFLAQRHPIRPWLCGTANYETLNIQDIVRYAPKGIQGCI